VANDFITMVTRVTSELRRSNLVVEAKNAINDAIAEAAKERFFFNGMRGQTFNTVPGTEYYDDLGLTEIDAAWYIQGSTRYNLTPESTLRADERADGNVISSQLERYSRSQDQMIRLYPVPTTIVPVYLDGYGKLTPYPLVNDADTNAWMTVAERYIRALAKSILLRDVIRDYKESGILNTIAEDYKNELMNETVLRLSTGELKATCF